MPSSDRLTLTSRIVLMLGILAGLTGMIAIKAMTRQPLPLPDRPLADLPDRPLAEPVPLPPPPAPVLPPPIDKQAVRARAMSAAIARCNQADGEFAGAANRLADIQLGAIDTFFAERQPGTRMFAERLLSLRGKWVFIRGQVSKAAEDEHYRFIRAEFEKYVFTAADLREVVARAVSGYVAELQGLENQLLIQLRVDLSQSDLAAAEVIPAIGSQDRFDAEYHRVAALVTPLVAEDLKADVARELASFIAGDIAARVAIKVLTAVAAKIGASAGILSAGAASSWATFGVGIVAAIVADLVLDKLLKGAGHDPVGAVAERVNATLAGIRDSIKDGLAEAKADWVELSGLATGDPDPEVRLAAATAADSITRSGNLGLRRELLQLHERRAAVRREAVKRLILTEEDNP